MSTSRRSLGVYSRPRPLGPDGGKICYNCGGPLPKGRRYNCSPACSEEWRCKTSPSHMRFLLHKRDKGVCSLCLVDTIALKREHDGMPGPNGSGWGGDTDAKREFRGLHGIPPGRISSGWWDADHIIPVIEGGGETGLSNFRTLCIPCHKKVTADLRARLAAKAKVERDVKDHELLAQMRSTKLVFGNQDHIEFVRALQKKKL